MIRAHNWGWVFVQATVAILILVGFESVTAMGGEAKNAKRDVPIAVIVSLLVQGLICYLFEYFAANYFLNSGYPMASASTSAAPIGDMMVVIGDAMFGAGRGRIFMLVEAFTVFLALIGTTLSCMNTGARVTYAMGKDQEVPEHFGMLHSKSLTPHKAIWTLAFISAIVGCLTVCMVFGDAGAPADSAIQALPHGFSPALDTRTHDKMAALPNSLLTITLASNFGTFLLYMLSCIICIVAFHKHPKFKVDPAFDYSGAGFAGESRLHGVLPDWSIHGIWHQDGAVARLGNSSRLGDLWRHLFHSRQQEDGTDDAGEPQRGQQQRSLARLWGSW